MHSCFILFIRFIFKISGFYFVFAIILNSSLSYAQNTQEKKSEINLEHQIRFRHDNDFLTFTDRYYSSGLFLSYGKMLKHGFFNSGYEQIKFSLIQEIYTPSNTITKNIVEMDRPYGGFLGLNLGWSYSKQYNNFETDLLLGIAGKASGAGDFHRWYHNALEVPKSPTWVYEIDNSFHINLYFNYSHEWLLAKGDFGIYLGVQPQFAIGTKDMYTQPELIAHFGKRNTMHQSSAYKKIGVKDRELFFSIRTGCRIIAHNAMLEGNILGDESPFLVNPKANLLYGGVDLHYSNGKNEYWFGIRFNSAETLETKSHKYIILSYALNF